MWKYSSTSVQKWSDPPGSKLCWIRTASEAPHHAALLVPLLPPRVRKINVHRRKRFRRHRLFKKLDGISHCHHRIGKPSFRQCAGRKLGIPQCDLNPQEIHVRTLRRRGPQNNPLPEPIFDLQRSVATENRAGIPGRRKLGDTPEVFREIQARVSSSQCAAAHGRGMSRSSRVRSSGGLAGLQEVLRKRDSHDDPVTDQIVANEALELAGQHLATNLQ